MEDRSVQYPQRYQLKKVEGTDDIYDLVPAPGEITAEGTLINKSALLKDETAALFKDLPENQVPDEVFRILSKAALVGEDGKFNLPNGDPVKTTKIVFGTYVGTGKYGTKNKNSLTFPEKPLLVIVSGPGIKPNAGTTYASAVMLNGIKELTVEGGSFNLYISWSGNTVSWYNTRGGAQQANSNGDTYTYLGLIEV